MVDTFFHIPDDKRDRLMHNYSYDHKARPGWPTAPNGRFTALGGLLSGGGGLLSTMEDYFKFADMLRRRQ